MGDVINMRDQSHRVTDQTRVIKIEVTDEHRRQIAERLELLKKENERKLLAKFFFGLGFGFVSFYFLTVFILSL